MQRYERFRANHDHMPGSGRIMRVTGRVVFRTGGWTCRLRTTEGNTGIDPRMLSLDLVLERPDGDTVPEVLTPCDVEWSADDPQIEYRQVQFRVAGGTEDDPPPVLDVEHPE